MGTAGVVQSLWNHGHIGVVNETGSIPRPSVSMSCQSRVMAKRDRGMDVGGCGLGGGRGFACLGNDIWEVAKATGSRCTTAKMRSADSVRVPGSLTRALDREVNPSGGQLSDSVQLDWATRNCCLSVA